MFPVLFPVLFPLTSQFLFGNFSKAFGIQGKDFRFGKAHCLHVLINAFFAILEPETYLFSEDTNFFENNADKPKIGKPEITSETLIWKSRCYIITMCTVRESTLRKSIHRYITRLDHPSSQ